MTQTRVELNNFFAEVQYKALRQAEISVGNRDEAFDILQDAMIRLAEKYADQPDDWPKLFQRILQNLIRDWHRRKKVRNILVWWNQVGEEKNSVEETLTEETIEKNEEGLNVLEPESKHSLHQISDRIKTAVQQLPLRQQEAFWLRAWWGHDVAETAFAMGCTEGSVKTHYSRAVGRLRELLGEFEL